MISENPFLQFLFYVNQLKFVPRTGWLLSGIADSEDVAAHSYGVAATAMLLADIVPAPIDHGRLLKMAILHDLAEAVITDLPWSATRYLGTEMKKMIEREAFATICSSLPSRGEYEPLMDEYLLGTSIEARIVHDADILECMIQAYTYERVGHKGLEEFWNPQKDVAFAFAESRELFLQLRQMRDQLSETK